MGNIIKSGESEIKSENRLNYKSGKSEIRNWKYTY